MRFLSHITLIFSLLFAQSVIAADDVPQGIYYKDSENGAVKIPAHSFTGRTTSDKFVFIFDVGKSYGLSLYQTKSDTEITDHSPKFLLILNPEGRTDQNTNNPDWVFSASNDPSNFMLCKLNEKYKARVLEIGAEYNADNSVLGPEYISHEELNVTRKSENSFILEPVHELKNGEYAFIYTGGFVNADIPPYIVFDFSIVNYTPESLYKVKQGMLYSEVAEIMQYIPKKKKKSNNRVEWNFPGAGKVIFSKGAVVDVIHDNIE